MQYKIDFQSIPWEQPVPGMRFKACHHDGKNVRLVEFTHDFVEKDWCRKGHVGYVLEGHLEVTFDGNTIVFTPGDGLFIPQGEKHRHMAKALTERVKLILIEEI